MKIPLQWSTATTSFVMGRYRYRPRYQRSRRRDNSREGLPTRTFTSTTTSRTTTSTSPPRLLLLARLLARLLVVGSIVLLHNQKRNGVFVNGYRCSRCDSSRGSVAFPQWDCYFEENPESTVALGILNPTGSDDPCVCPELGDIPVQELRFPYTCTLETFETLNDGCTCEVDYGDSYCPAERCDYTYECGNPDDDDETNTDLYVCWNLIDPTDLKLDATGIITDDESSNPNGIELQTVIYCDDEQDNMFYDLSPTDSCSLSSSSPGKLNYFSFCSYAEEKLEYNGGYLNDIVCPNRKKLKRYTKFCTPTGENGIFDPNWDTACTLPIEGEGCPIPFCDFSGREFTFTNYDIVISSTDPTMEPTPLPSVGPSDSPSTLPSSSPSSLPSSSQPSTIPSELPTTTSPSESPTTTPPSSKDVETIVEELVKECDCIEFSGGTTMSTTTTTTTTTTGMIMNTNTICKNNFISNNYQLLGNWKQKKLFNTYEKICISRGVCSGKVGIQLKRILDICNGCPKYRYNRCNGWCTDCLEYNIDLLYEFNIISRKRKKKLQTRYKDTCGIPQN